MDNKSWNKMPLLEQTSNIYGEIERFIREKKQSSYVMAIKLLNYTINDPKHIKHQEEFIYARIELEEYKNENNRDYLKEREKSILVYWSDWVYYFVKEF